MATTISLTQPSVGSTGWGANVNQNFADSESALNGDTATKGAARNLLTTSTASSDATIDFTTKIDSTYKHYFFELIDVVPATDGVDFHMLVSTDGGTSWKEGASDYKYASFGRESNGNNISGNSQTDSKILLNFTNSNIGSAAGEGYDGQVHMFDAAGTAQFQRFLMLYVYNRDNDRLAYQAAGGQYSTAEAIDGIRFLMSSGNIESGTFNLYGVS